MATTRSRKGDRSPSERQHVGLTVPRRVKAALIAAAGALDWSAGDWVLAAAAEYGPELRSAFFTSVARLALGEELDTVGDQLATPTTCQPPPPRISDELD